MMETSYGDAMVAFSLALVGLTLGICETQTATPLSLPELNYPPIAKATRVQGDAVVSFRITADGRTADKVLVSGPAMFCAAALENVKAWHFDPKAAISERPYKVTFTSC